MSEEEILKQLYIFSSWKIKNKKINLIDSCGFSLGYLEVETIQKAVKGLIDLYEELKDE